MGLTVIQTKMKYNQLTLVGRTHKGCNNNNDNNTCTKSNQENEMHTILLDFEMQKQITEPVEQF